MDCTFEKLRGEETQIGNFLADLMMTEHMTDFALLSSGSCRLNEIVPSGEIKLNLILNMLPFPDKIGKINCTGL